MDAAEEEILEERLSNWGRWARSRSPQGTSPLWHIMHARGFQYEREYREEPRNPPDEKDAQTINRAWNLLPNVRTPKGDSKPCAEKRFLVLRYVLNRPGYEAFYPARRSAIDIERRRVLRMFLDVLRKVEREAGD